MNQDNMFSNDYVYGLQQQSEANYQRAERAEEEIEALEDELTRLRSLVVPADAI
jgi:hypothetical protein